MPTRFFFQPGTVPDANYMMVRDRPLFAYNKRPDGLDGRHARRGRTQKDNRDGSEKSHAKPFG